MKIQSKRSLPSNRSKDSESHKESLKKCYYKMERTLITEPALREKFYMLYNEITEKADKEAMVKVNARKASLQITDSKSSSSFSSILSVHAAASGSSSGRPEDVAEAITVVAIIPVGSGRKRKTRK
jgi:hypothetical protein